MLVASITILTKNMNMSENEANDLKLILELEGDDEASRRHATGHSMHFHNVNFSYHCVTTM